MKVYYLGDNELVELHSQKKNNCIPSLHSHVEPIFRLLKIHGQLEDHCNHGSVLHVYLWRAAMVVY